MTDSDRKKALKEIEVLETNNKQMEDEANALEAIHDKDEETMNKITSLREKINDNNIALTNLRELLKDEIDKQVDKFNSDSIKIEKHLEKVKATFVLEASVEEINVNELLTGLTEELKEFETEASELVEEMNQFKELTGSDDFNLSPKEIKVKVKEFKTKLRNLKRKQIVKYNLRIERINSVIREYKETIKEGMEGYDLVCELEILSECTATVGEWRHISYLSSINYNKMLETVKKIKELEEKLNNGKTFDNIDNDINYINEKIIKLDVEVTEEVDYETFVSSKVELEEISDLLLALGTRLENEKNELPSELYEKYNNQYRELMQAYLALQKKFKNIEKNIKTEEVNDYDRLYNRVDAILSETLDFSSLIASVYGRVSSSSLIIFETKYKNLEDRLINFKNELEKAYADKLIDENQYKNLSDAVTSVSFNLNNINTELKDPKMFGVVETTDVFGFLNGSIDGVEKALDSLEDTVSKMEKPVKDKNVRKNIDAIFKKLELEIKELEKQLELYKNTDEEKYEETKERLNNAKKRMGVISKNYRRKCPFLVRTVKSAKHFFKKYKKVLLIAAGLAAFAMLSHSVIIPAIMHGNIMVAGLSPALRGPVKTINNLLGGLIGATKDKMGFWYLANGVRLNAHAAASSLLKGLAISGVGSATLIAPVVVAIKKLIEKMKMAELKEKLIAGKDKVVETAKKGIQNTKEKITTISENAQNKRASSLAKKEIKKNINALFKNYVNSGLSVSEYCVQNEISGVMAELLKAYAEETENQKVDLASRKGGK